MTHRHRSGRYEGPGADYAGFCVTCGKLIPPPDHGSFGRYAAGCRCEPCVTHRKEYDAARYRANRRPTMAERLAASEAATIEARRERDEMRALLGRLVDQHIERLGLYNPDADA